MRHLRIVHDGPGWSYWHRARALARHAPSGWRVTLADEYDGELGLAGGPVDLVLALNYHHIDRFRERLDATGSEARLVTSYNTGWPRRRDRLELGLALADATVFVNRRSWETAGRPPGSVQISNGVDLDVFRPTVDPVDRAPRALWCGSRYHRRLKGYDELLVPLAARLERRGVATDFRLVDLTSDAPLAEPRRMAAWYNTGTVYVCASEVEGTPNTALEAAACGLAVVSTPVGNLPDLVEDGVNGYLVERSIDALERAVLATSARSAAMGRAMLEAIQAWDWRHAAAAYYRLFDRLLATAPGTRVAGARSPHKRP